MMNLKRITEQKLAGLLFVLTIGLVMLACGSGQGAAVRLPQTAEPPPTPEPATTLTLASEAQPSIGDAPEGVDEMQLDAQQADELAELEAEGEAEAQFVIATRTTAQETAVARGYAEPEDFTSVFVGKWLQTGQPARQVIVVLNEDNSAELSMQDATDPTVSTDEVGAWVFDSPGLAIVSISGDTARELELHYIAGKGLWLQGSEFGDEGVPMALYTPR